MNIRKKQLFWGELQRIPLDFDPEPYGTAVLVPAWPWLKPTPWGGLGFQKKMWCLGRKSSQCRGTDDPNWKNSHSGVGNIFCRVTFTWRIWTLTHTRCVFFSNGAENCYVGICWLVDHRKISSPFRSVRGPKSPFKGTNLHFLQVLSLSIGDGWVYYW